MTRANSAPDQPQDDARDDATAASVLDDRADLPGGGGLGGQDAADAGAAAAVGNAGGTAPNAPMDTGVSADDARASDEAKAAATAEDQPAQRPVL